MNCCLCASAACRPRGPAWGRPLYECPVCRLAFVPPEARIAPAAEKARYDRHTNNPDDAGYVRHLESVAAELRRIPLPAPRILDFGAGPHFVLTRLLRARGYDCTPYDPLYGLRLPADAAPYDAIVACEVLEHLRDLPRSLQEIRTLCAPGGYVLARTEFCDAVTDFGTWWYANDETHINFFHTQTLPRLAALLGRRVVFTDARRFALFGPDAPDGASAATGESPA
jgi:SAM-dependent methyltransferase